MLKVDLMLRLYLHTNHDNNTGDGKKHQEVMDMFMVLMVVMASQIYTCILNSLTYTH